MKKILLLSCVLTATVALAANSPYAAKVLEYRPAPGQFVNDLPKFAEGDTYETVLQKAETALVGKRIGSLVHLGSFGGFITIAFDHPVVNTEGNDFAVYGNAFENSSEPGVVCVSVDVNKNGVADDPWYELKGSVYDDPATQHKVVMTYHRPDPSYDNGEAQAIDQYISVTCDDGVERWLPKLTFHTQSYYPGWMTEDSYSLEGTLLKNNGIDNGGMWSLPAYEFGYADNYPNNHPTGNQLDIDWAIDEDGNAVKLEKIDFVKVYTGMFQVCGWLGETSTEVSGFEDLHPDAPQPVPTGVEEALAAGFDYSYVAGQLNLNLASAATVRVLTLDGKMLSQAAFEEGFATISLPKAGILLVQIQTEQGVQVLKLNTL